MIRGSKLIPGMMVTWKKGLGVNDMISSSFFVVACWKAEYISELYNVILLPVLSPNLRRSMFAFKVYYADEFEVISCAKECA